MKRALSVLDADDRPGRAAAFLCLAFITVAGTLLPARTYAQPRFDETIEVRLLEIDARVVDRDGNPVHGLGIDDFVLLEDGKRVPIESVFEIRSTVPQPGAEPEIGESESSTRAPVKTKPRAIVFFLDQLPLNPAERRELFRDLGELARTSLRDGDTAAVIVWAMSARTIVPLIRDRQRVVDTFEALAGERDSFPDTTPFTVRAALAEDLAADSAATWPGMSMAGSYNFDMEEQRRRDSFFCAEEVVGEVRRKIATLKTVVNALQGERTSALVYVSQRMPEDAVVYCQNLGPLGITGAQPSGSYSTSNLLRELGRSANAAGVTLYALRPEIPASMTDASEKRIASWTPGQRDAARIANELVSLGILAEATGGIVGYGLKQGKVTLSTIEQDLDSYYSIAYRSTIDGRDRESRIRLKTTDKSLEVRARRSLVVKSDLTRARDTLVANLYGLDDRGEFLVEVKPTGESETRRRRRIGVDVRFRAESLTFVERDGGRVATYRLLVQSADDFGALSELSEETRELVRPENVSTPVSIEFALETRLEGTLTAIGIFDETSGLAGFTTIDTRVQSDD